MRECCSFIVNIKRVNDMFKSVSLLRINYLLIRWNQCVHCERWVSVSFKTWSIWICMKLFILTILNLPKYWIILFSKVKIKSIIKVKKHNIEKILIERSQRMKERTMKDSLFYQFIQLNWIDRERHNSSGYL